MRKPMLWALAAIVAWGVFAPAARAELQEGDSPPAFEGKEFVNTDELSLQKLKGRLVLLEFFGTH